MDPVVEVARRQEETQIPPLRQAQETVPYAAEWMRIAFMQFLSNESDLWESKLMASGNLYMHGPMLNVRAEPVPGR